MTDRVPPAEVLKLFHADDYTITDLNPNYCEIQAYGLELRFQRCFDGTWDFDEIVGPCRLHIEQMDRSNYWVGIDGDGGSVHINIGSVSGRAKVRMTGWSEPD